MAAAKLVVRLLEALVRDGVNSWRRLFVVLMKESRWLAPRSRSISPLAYWLSAAAASCSGAAQGRPVIGESTFGWVSLGVAGGIGFILAMVGGLAAPCCNFSA